MRPSSSPFETSPPGGTSTPGGTFSPGGTSTPDEPGLFDEVLARGPVRAAVADQAWLAAMLAAEAALVRAQATLGLVPADAAATVAAACRPDRYQLSALGRAAAGPGNPVLPLVEAVRAEVGQPHAGFVHFGATSQDILDTAAMLVTREALTAIEADLAGAAAAAARLAAAHRDTPMAGRTLLQYGLPTTFGLVAAGWLVALRTAAGRLAELRRTGLAVQLGGGVGTRAGWPGAGAELTAAFARALDLAVPVLPWHTDRTRIAELAGALGTAAGALGKAARDVTLLASSELGEVAEAAPGASSAMPHKRNPVASVCALAGALPVPGLVGTLLSTMVQEHQRAAGAWHAEWRPLRELLVAVGSAAAWLRECLAGLIVHPEVMRQNLTQAARTTADPGAGTEAAPTTAKPGAAAGPGATGEAGILVDAALTRYPSPEEP